MAHLCNCQTCGVGIIDANYCSQECAAAEPRDILFSIKQDIEQTGTISESTKQRVLAHNWTSLTDYLKQKRERDFDEGQRAIQKELEELQDWEAANQAVAKVQAERLKRRNAK